MSIVSGVITPNIAISAPSAVPTPIVHPTPTAATAETVTTTHPSTSPNIPTVARQQSNSVILANLMDMMDRVFRRSLSSSEEENEEDEEEEQEEKTCVCGQCPRNRFAQYAHIRDPFAIGIHTWMTTMKKSQRTRNEFTATTKKDDDDEEIYEMNPL